MSRLNGACKCTMPLTPASEDGRSCTSRLVMSVSSWALREKLVAKLSGRNSSLCYMLLSMLKFYGCCFGPLPLHCWRQVF